MTIVLDASFAIHASTTPDEASAAASARPLADDLLTAPCIFWHEVASALRTMRLRRGLSEELADAALRKLGDLGVVLEPATADLRAVISVSERHQLTIYDAAYLELALRTGARLATRDQGLVSAAARAGVPVIGPSPR